MTNPTKWRAIASAVFAVVILIAAEWLLVAIMMPPPTPPTAIPGSDSWLGSYLRWLAFLLACTVVPFAAFGLSTQSKGMPRVALLGALACGGALWLANGIERGAMTSTPDKVQTTRK